MTQYQIKRKRMSNKIKTIKPKKCKICGEKFTPFRSTQIVCSPLCAIAHGKEKTKKKEQKRWNLEKKIIKENLKTKSELENDLQKEVNKLIRFIDHGQKCISCGEFANNKKNNYRGSGSEQAGHYHTTGGNPAVRFHLFNIYLQCYHCNVPLSANIIGYNEGLRNVFGTSHQEFVEMGLKGFPPLKMTRTDLIETIKLIRQKIREFQKEGLVNLSTEERLNIRNKYQKIIGIYD